MSLLAHRVGAVLLAIAAMCSAAVAWAQAPAPAPAPAPAIVAPKPLVVEPAPYPADAEGDESVLLELLVTEDGHVEEASVKEGREPFASAARAAAEKWTYEPAKRGDRAVRARIRVRVDFHPPQKAAEEPPPVADLPAQPKKPAPPPVDEVRVRGVRQEVGTTTLGGSEVRQLPGAFGDAFRAIEVLPGVTPIVSGLPYFFIRGAPPGNTGYFIDGVRVPLLFHFGVAQSVISPGLIDHVDFYPGGYPARFGRFTGGIINGETRAPVHKSGIHGEYNARLLDTGALVEAPLGNRAEVLAAGRYGYPGLLLRLFAPEARLEYWDYQLRASVALDDKNRLTLFSFGSHDYLATVDEDTGETEGATTIRFHRVDLRWDHKASKNTRVRVAGTIGYDETRAEDSGVRDYLAGVRVQWESERSRTLTLRGGADVLYDRYDVLQQEQPSGDPADTDAIPARNEVTAGAWIDAIWKVTDRYELVPGLRVDYFANDASIVGTTAQGSPGGAAWGLDPRLASRLRVTRALTYVATAGIPHQPPSLPGTIPGFQPGQLRAGLQKAVQLGQGVEVALPLELTFSPTLFVSNYLDLTDAITSCGILSERGDRPDDCASERVRGRAYGFEVLLKRPLTKRLSGLVSYTLSRSTRQTRATFGQQFPSEIASEFDRTHVLNVIGAMDLGRGWRAGLRFFYYTGRPYSDRIAGIDIPPYNVRRFPAFFRFDWRIEKRWRISNDAHVSFVVEWLNSLLKKEAVGLDCDQLPGRIVDQCKPEEIGPISVPSLGVEGAF